MYRLRPKLEVKQKIEIVEGYEKISGFLTEEMKTDSNDVIAIETNPGVDSKRLYESLKKNANEIAVIHTDSLYFSPEKIYAKIYEDLGEDPVFGKFSNKDFSDFLDPMKLKELHTFMRSTQKKTIVVGVGASLVIDFDKVIYADITRWENLKRLKKGMGNWKGYKEREFGEKLKRAYYFEWPLSRELKDNLLKHIDYYLDTTDAENPKIMDGGQLRNALREFTDQPFRLVPFFEEGIWGGQWMKKKFKVGQDKANLAWCFDGVPEENSLLIKSGEAEIEVPAENLILLYPQEVLGKKVFGRYGKDFPIRFDYLDTMGGQNLSLQVHPTFDYAYRKFGAKYTQDESYYILDCEEDAVVYIGVKDGVDREELIQKFVEAQETGIFDDDPYIYKVPVRKHDHFSIPAGTIHSSGKNCVVLEISNTPNRFTFKLWDWGRVDLDGKPRPISIHHGKHVLNVDHNESFVKKELYNPTKKIQEEDGFLEEHTGLHESEAIETRRFTFSKKIKQSTESNVNMLNLVEGDHIQILSPENKFPPFDVYYGETWILPADTGDYEMIPLGKDDEVKVLKAYIR